MLISLHSQQYSPYDALNKFVLGEKMSKLLEQIDKHAKSTEFNWYVQNDPEWNKSEIMMPEDVLHYFNANYLRILEALGLHTTHQTKTSVIYVVSVVDYGDSTTGKPRALAAFKDEADAYAFARHDVERWVDDHANEGIIECDFERLSTTFDCDPSDGCEWSITAVEVQ